MAAARQNKNPLLAHKWEPLPKNRDLQLLSLLSRLYTRFVNFPLVMKIVISNKISKIISASGAYVISWGYLPGVSLIFKLKPKKRQLCLAFDAFLAHLTTLQK